MYTQPMKIISSNNKIRVAFFKHVGVCFYKGVVRSSIKRLSPLTMRNTYTITGGNQRKVWERVSDLTKKKKKKKCGAITGQPNIINKLRRRRCEYKSSIAKKSIQQNVCVYELFVFCNEQKSSAMYGRRKLLGDKFFQRSRWRT
jgi:hypothetical protein